MQEDYDDEDDWNPCKAAGVCLTLMAACTEDAIVPHVVPFVKEHLCNADWRLRDAAIMALGCIMEGPDPDQLAQHVVEVKGCPHVTSVMFFLGHSPINRVDEV